MTPIREMIKRDSSVETPTNSAMLKMRKRVKKIEELAERRIKELKMWVVKRAG